MLSPDLYFSHKIYDWLLSNLVPMWFRDKWPMKRFYWQQEDFDRADKYAKELSERLKWE